MYEIKFRGKKGKFFYKDPKLMMIDEAYAKRLFESENPVVDFEEARKVEEEFLKLKADTEMLKFNKEARRRR